jgi:hypothetical protein
MIMKSKQRKRLRRFSQIKSISIIGITVLSLGFTAINASAATLDTPETRTISQTATSDKNLPNQIQGFINDVRSFFRGDLFGNITQLVQSTIGRAEVPDLGQVVSQIMTATFSPIALGLSLLPLGSKPIWAWASGFISLFGVQLGYNIVVGLAATVIVSAGAQSASDLAFLAFISIFAPALALLIAGGGGVALYTGINNRVPALLNAAFDGVIAVAIGFAK